MADWQAFATAFLGDSATYINERKDKAEDYADKLAEQAERNKGKLAELRQTADAQNSFVGQARALHATDAQIEAALDAGPNGLSTLVNTLDTLRATYGSNFNAAMVKEAAALPEAFSPTGNLDVYARYGLGSQTMGDIEAPKGGWFARAMGTDAKARARAEADAEAFGDTGMSVYDMAELDSVTGYTSRNSGSYLRYTPPKVFNPANTAAAEEAIYDREQILVDSETYKSFQTRIDGVYEPTEREANAKVAEIKQERAAWLRNNLTEYARSQQDLYGESWVAAMGPTLQAMGLSSDALKATGRGTDSTTELPAATEEAFDPTTLNLPESLTVDDEGLVNGTVTVTHVSTEGEPQDITFEVEGGLVLKDGVPLRPEEAEALLREVSKTTAAPEVAAEEGDEATEPTRLLDGKDGVFQEESAAALQEKYGEEFGQEGTQKVLDSVKAVWNKTGEYMIKGADRGAGMALGSANEVMSWLAVGLGGLTEVIGLDGTEAFATAGEFDEVAGNLWNNGISAADASQKIVDIYHESLTRDTGDEERMAAAYGFKPKVPPTREEINTGSTPEGAAIKESINFLVSGVQQLIPVTDRLSTESKSMPDGYIPVQIGATELNLPSVIEGLSVAARNALEKDLKAWSERPTPRGYQPTQMGATELNLPKMLEALKPKTRNMVEKELQALPETSSDTNLDRMEQSRLGQVEAEQDTGLRPAESVLSRVVAPYIYFGQPLAPDEELAVGIEAVVEGLSGNGMDKRDLDSLIIELKEKFGEDAVKAELQRVTRGGAAKGGTE